MAKEPKRIEVTPDVALAIREAERDGRPVELHASGATYHVVPSSSTGLRSTLWRTYDPEAVRAAVRQFAGTIPTDEADAMIANLYRAREEGSRPADRP